VEEIVEELNLRDGRPPSRLRKPHSRTSSNTWDSPKDQSFQEKPHRLSGNFLSLDQLSRGLQAVDAALVLGSAAQSGHDIAGEEDYAWAAQFLHRTSASRKSARSASRSVGLATPCFSPLLHRKKCQVLCVSRWLAHSPLRTTSGTRRRVPHSCSLLSHLLQPFFKRRSLNTVQSMTESLNGTSAAVFREPMVCRFPEQWFGIGQGCSQLAAAQLRAKDRRFIDLACRQILVHRRAPGSSGPFAASQRATHTCRGRQSRCANLATEPSSCSVLIVLRVFLVASPIFTSAACSMSPMGMAWITTRSPTLMSFWSNGCSVLHNLVPSTTMTFLRAVGSLHADGRSLDFGDCAHDVLLVLVSPGHGGKR